MKALVFIIIANDRAISSGLGPLFIGSVVGSFLLSLY